MSNAALSTATTQHSTARKRSVLPPRPSSRAATAIDLETIINPQQSETSSFPMPRPPPPPRSARSAPPPSPRFGFSAATQSQAAAPQSAKQRQILSTGRRSPHRRSGAGGRRSKSPPRSPTRSSSRVNQITASEPSGHRQHSLSEAQVPRSSPPSTHRGSSPMPAHQPRQIAVSFAADVRAIRRRLVATSAPSDDSRWPSPGASKRIVAGLRRCNRDRLSRGSVCGRSAIQRAWRTSRRRKAAVANREGGAFSFCYIHHFAELL